MQRKMLMLCFSVALGITSLNAQTPYPENAYEKVHEFDFWLGEWDVFDWETEELIAHSRILPIVDSIGIQEHYYGANGDTYSSTSISKFNFSKDQWEQYYINNQGLTFRFLGNLDGPKMVIGNRKEFKNRPSYNRLTWEPRDDGSIRHTWIQRWEDEEEWRTVFDCIYRRKEELVEKE